MLKLRGHGPDVFYVAGALPVLDRADVDALKAVVDRSTFKRTRICVHEGTDDPLQEMFIVQLRATYIRPHKHLDKVESLLVLEGEADAVFFDDGGEIQQVVPLGPYQSPRRFFYRIGSAIYHSLLIHTATFVFKEATLGPFDKARTVFAPWSPAEGDDASVRTYMSGLGARVRARAEG
jgi:cupin fold WbuC family metalloprotein